MEHPCRLERFFIAWRKACRSLSSSCCRSSRTPAANAATTQARTEQDKRLVIEQQLAAADQHHTKELSDAQRNQALLRDRLATADVRLSVLLDATDSASGCNVPAPPGAVGVVHAIRRAQLDPAHAQRIITITDDGDNAVIALRACQAYAKKVSMRK
ncbi:lysis system i-spanin subunit Rz [Pseudomonas sp. SDO5522_S412]